MVSVKQNPIAEGKRCARWDWNADAGEQLKIFGQAGV